MIAATVEIGDNLASVLGLVALALILYVLHRWD